MPLRNWPIQRQVTGMLLLVSALALLVTTVAFVIYQVVTFRQATRKDLATLGRVIAANSTAALAFANEADAREILAALRAQPHIVAAALYDRTGHLFAKYPPELSSQALPSALGGSGYTFEHGYVSGFEPVTEPGSPPVGTLYLRSDMTAVSDALRLSAAIGAAALAVSMLVAYLLARTLQGQISRPVLALAETAQVVSARQDYTVRAPKLGGGEFGTLTDAFNQMLGRIEEQNRTVRESKDRLDLALRASGVGTWSWDVGSNRIVWDDFTPPLFGFVSGMFSGRYEDFIGLVHPEDRTRVKGEMADAAARGSVYSTEYRVVWRDGTERVLAAAGRVHRDPVTTKEALTGVCWDVTERRRLREELQRYAAELERRVADRTRELEARNAELRSNAADLLAANQELDAFAYSVSHDLRAPLRSIDGFSQILLEDHAGTLGASGSDALRRVRASTQRMGVLIDDLLNLARITRAEVRAEHVDMSAVATEIMAELQRAAPERRVDVVIAPNLETQGDARLLRIALENLLRNSWKYTAKQPLPRIEFQSVDENGNRVFLVRDNGAGFDMKFADKLFGVFQRLHSASEFEGTGVGLATVRRIITRHGGRIWAEAAPGTGATFYFTLSPQAAGYPSKVA